MNGNEFFSLPASLMFAASRAVYFTATPSSSRSKSAVCMTAAMSVLPVS